MSFDELAAAFELEEDADEDEEVASTRGVVVLLAGMGGPDALRQLLSSLPSRVPVPVLVWQQLNAGTHDRLASQLAKTGKVETYLAQAGAPLKPGKVGILPPGIGVACGERLSFVDDPSSPSGLLESLQPLGDLAVVVALSGTDAGWLGDAEKWRSQPVRLLAQSPETCFEAAACEALVEQGIVSAAPGDLAIRALVKWHEDV